MIVDLYYYIHDIMLARVPVFMIIMKHIYTVTQNNAGSNASRASVRLRPYKKELNNCDAYIFVLAITDFTEFCVLSVLISI